MQNFRRSLVLFINIFLVFSATKYVEAGSEQGTEIVNDFLDFEKKADDLVEAGRIFFLQLLQDDTARKTIGVIMLSVKNILEDESASLILISISQQIKDTLIDANKGSVSVKYIHSGIVELLTNEVIEETYQALLQSFEHVIRNPNTPLVVDQAFDVIFELTLLEQGPDIFLAVEDGIRGVARLPNPRDDVCKGFKTLKYLMVTNMRGQVKNFVSG